MPGRIVRRICYSATIMIHNSRSRSVLSYRNHQEEEVHKSSHGNCAKGVFGSLIFSHWNVTDAIRQP